MSQALDALLRDALQDVNYGDVSLNIKRVQGRNEKIDIVKINRQRVSDSAGALTLIGTMLKYLKEAGGDGSLTFTIDLKAGTAEHVLVHDFKRVTRLENGTYA